VDSRPQRQIAVAQHACAVSHGVRFAWLSADAGYGEVPGFHFALEDLGQRYMLEVPSIFHGWLHSPGAPTKQDHALRQGGRRARYPRLKVKDPPTIDVRNRVKYCDEFRKQAWEKFHIKDSTLGPAVFEAKAARIYLKRDGLPSGPRWLIVARNLLNSEEIQYFVANAPEGTPLEVLLHVAFQRYHVERCFEEEKGELGMDHFEVRNWRSLKRHLLLTAVSHLFLAKVRQQWGEKRSEPDSLPAPAGLSAVARRQAGGGSVGAFAVADRSGARRFLGQGSGDHHGNTAPHRKGTTLPCEGPQTAVA
jgi:SRSO17 transposase